MLFTVKSLTKKDIEKVFDSKLEPFAKATQLEFQKVSQRFEQIDKRFDQMDQRFDRIDQRFDRIDQRFGKLENKFDKSFSVLNDFMALYKNHNEQITMLSGQTRRLTDRVTKLESGEK